MRIHSWWGRLWLCTALTVAQFTAVATVSAAEEAQTETESSAATGSLDAAAGEAAATPATGGGIEEIVVTAQRRAQSMQDVPISISAVSAESLQATGVDATDQLASVSSGLLMTRQVGAVMPYIRGIGTATPTGGQESPVPLYVDGFYIPQLSALNFSFNNIERIEVLKGPQGTLFGRNATGGLIQVITRDPSSAPMLKVGLSYDNYQTPEATLYATSAVAENLNADVSAVYADQGKGFGNNLTTGAETGRRRELGLRSTWLYTMSKATTARLSIDYTNMWSTIGVGRQAASGVRTIDGLSAPPDFQDIRNNFEPSYDFEGLGGGLKVSHDFDDVQFVSLTSYRTGDSRTFFDQDATALRVVDLSLYDKNHTFTQELQLLSKDSGALSWIGGLYYFAYDVDFDTSVAGSAAMPVGGSYVQSSHFNTRSYAAYAQTTYALTGTTNITAGLRYTADEREFRAQQDNADGTTVPAAAPHSQNEGKPSWRLAIDHKFADTLLGYASYNRGFKSGVYNVTNINQNPVDAEVVDAYEIGLKSDLMGRRLRVNVAGFYYDYDDLQLAVPGPAATTLTNAAAADIYGAELEISALPTDRLEVSLNLAWLKTKYVDFPGAQITEPKPAPAGGNYLCVSGQTTPSSNCPDGVMQQLAARTASGNDLIRAPKHSGSLSVRYSIPSPIGEFAVSGAYTYTGSFYWEPDNRAKQKSYGLLNARLDWQDPGQQYRLYLFGKNLTDEKYTQFLSSGSFGDLLAPQPPRTFGVGVEARFE